MPETIPDTTAYLILGLVVTAIIMGAFITSMMVRQRNLDRDIELIQQLSEEN